MHFKDIFLRFRHFSAGFKGKHERVPVNCKKGRQMQCHNLRVKHIQK